jgi:ribosomal protein L37AE/L43A
MLNLTGTVPNHRPSCPRKIRLDRNLYSAHSVRATSGDAKCDHDFEVAPTAKQADFAIWNCTRCGRVFRYETWKSDRSSAASKESLHRPQDRNEDVSFLADGGMLFCDPVAF